MTETPIALRALHPTVAGHWTLLYNEIIKGI